ncbi:hypothetical protein [Teredinibacter franksiae]|uniref:hypothetical protein n=1 Tax=Teredinibacter franksiae TaxID=2761453 RepID=UPI0016286660|nr:hypothetical protein [Teredinibacter franksiae]
MKIYIFVLTLFFLSGCVDTPTHSTTVVDDRPRIAFESSQIENANQYQVYVDGINYGALTKYPFSEKNKSALRVIAGKHKVEIKLGQTLIATFDVVLGDHETRVLKIPANE